MECVFSEYELALKPTPALDEADYAKVIGFDAWMRERTERAHREFMKRTS